MTRSAAADDSIASGRRPERCPFCGFAARRGVAVSPEQGNQATAWCANTGCALHRPDDPMTLDQWNRRPPPKRQTAPPRDRWLEQLARRLDSELGAFGPRELPVGFLVRYAHALFAEAQQTGRKRLMQNRAALLVIGARQSSSGRIHKQCSDLQRELIVRFGQQALTEQRQRGDQTVRYALKVTADAETGHLTAEVHEQAGGAFETFVQARAALDDWIGSA